MQYIVSIVFALWFLPPQTMQHASRETISAWDSTKNWKIYHLPNTNQEIRIPVDSLKYLEYLPLSDYSIHSMLRRVIKRTVQGPVMFQGVYLVSYEAPTGETVKVLVSSSGGFFYVPRDNSYFELPDDPQTRQDWLTLFLQTYMKMEK